MALKSLNNGTVHIYIYRSNYMDTWMPVETERRAVLTAQG